MVMDWPRVQISRRILLESAMSTARLIVLSVVLVVGFGSSLRTAAASPLPAVSPEHGTELCQELPREFAESAGASLAILSSPVIHVRGCG
jgi:hypothetical protein